LDSSVLIDAWQGRNKRAELLLDLSEQNIRLAYCPINVTEVYMGMRPGEEAKTEKLLRSLELYLLTWAAAKYGGRAGNIYER
jgi:predicted nucleic acid-binding protein